MLGRCRRRNRRRVRRLAAPGRRDGQPARAALPLGTLAANLSAATSSASWWANFATRHVLAPERGSSLAPAGHHVWTFSPKVRSRCRAATMRGIGLPSSIRRLARADRRRPRRGARRLWLICGAPYRLIQGSACPAPTAFTRPAGLCLRLEDVAVGVLVPERCVRHTAIGWNYIETYQLHRGEQSLLDGYRPRGRRRRRSRGS